MKKTFVLDTCVLLYNPLALKDFQDNTVIIPLAVIEELDHKKQKGDSTGKHARMVARALDELRNKGSLIDGVVTDYGTTIKVQTCNKTLLSTLPSELEADKVDNAILAIALANPGAILVTKDINLRIKADAVGIPAEDYTTDKIDFSELYTGHREVMISGEEMAELFSNGIELEGEYYENECLTLYKNTDPNHTALGIYCNGVVQPTVDLPKNTGLKIKPQNREQQFALQLLLDPTIQLVTITGKAGTGKTLMALGAGLHQVGTLYTKMLVARPIVGIGKDLGYLPGSMEEKLDPWMQPIWDNLEVLLSNGVYKNTKRKGYEDLIEQNLLSVEAITYIRGRSLPKNYMIIDECLPYDTFILTEDGKRELGGLFVKWMRENEPMPKVRSFNVEKEIFEWKTITHMWHRGKKDLVKVHSGNRKTKCTPNHLFLTPEGWVEAQNLREGDMLVCSNPEDIQINKSLTVDQEQIFYGSFLGDGSFDSCGVNRYRLSVNHGMKQEAYCKWKASFFESKTNLNLNCGYNPDEPKIGFCTHSYATKDNFPCPAKRCPDEILQKIDLKGLAIWFMDDGSTNKEFNSATISVHSFDEYSVIKMIDTLSFFGIEAKYSIYEKGIVIRLNKEPYLKFCDLISPYIHPNLEYKIAPQFRRNIDLNNWDYSKKDFGYSIVKKVEFLEEQEHVFDMEVEDNHNFLVASSSRGVKAGNGCLVVHNCQNITPHEIKTILTRAGEGTKIVLVGDVEQIDNFYLDPGSNGLSYVIEKFKHHPIAAHITMTKGERSELSELSASLL